MLQLVNNLGQLRFSQLMEIYIEGNLEKTEDGLTLLEAEQDFYQYLQEVFFPTPGAKYCIWTENDQYVSALRLEPYRDGWLLEALETAPQHRRKGYAQQLVHAVTALPEFAKIYSHVHRENLPSLKLHEECGFQKILDYAVYIDGSVNRHCITLCHEYGKPE